MLKNPKYRPYIKRLAIIFLICLAFVLAFNEVTYSIFRESSDRKPQAVEIVIPAGTAQRVAAGEAPPTIPTDLTFVAGDVLEVTNNDSVDHQLGPLWIPAGTTASLALNVPQKLVMTCSFETSKIMNIDVRQPTSLNDRLTALGLGVPTLTVLVFLYSLAAMPLDDDGKKKKGKKVAVANG
jgi:hypothetical protein